MERRRFTREFKLEAVRLIRDRGVSYAQASQDLNVHPTQLRNWVKALAADPQQAFPGQGQMKAEQLEIAPDAPGSIGPIAADEARSNLGAEFFIAAAASAARSLQPGVQSSARDTERPAHPVHGPDPPVLRNEGELHVDSFAK